MSAVLCQDENSFMRINVIFKLSRGGRHLGEWFHTVWTLKICILLGKKSGNEG